MGATMAMIDKTLIKDVLLAKIGYAVSIYSLTYGLDASGEVVDKTRTLLGTETVYIHVIDEKHELARKGLYLVGEGLGVFPYDTKIQAEYQVVQTFDTGTSARSITWNVISVETPQVENEVKYKRARLRKAVESA